MAPPPVPRDPAPITAEDVTKARTAIKELERVARRVTGSLIVLGVGGLVFTAANVTEFAIGHGVHWGIAWMLDPLVSVALLSTLFIDGALAKYGYRPGGWPFILRWFAGLSTWLMNCWTSLYPDNVFTWVPQRPDAAGLVLHSVIPALVIILAEAGSQYRDFITAQKSAHIITLSDWKKQQTAATEAATAKAAAEKAERARIAEEERQRTAKLKAAAEEARIDGERKRAQAEAEALRIHAQGEAKARLEEERRKTAAEEEERRIAEEDRREKAAKAAAHRELEARKLDAQLADESAAQARADERAAAAQEAELERERIAAEAQAEATRKHAEAEARKAIAEAEEKNRAAEEKRRRTAETHRAATAETTGRPHPDTTAEPQKRTAIPATRTAEVDDVRGAEAKRQQIEAARFDAAVLILLDQEPTRKVFAERYGRSETWGRDRFTEAAEAMKDDEYSALVLAEADKRTAPEVAHSA